MKPPQPDNRTYREIVHQALMLARSYFPAGEGTIQWDSIHEPVNKDDPAYRMLEIFARLMELLIRRFNKIPVKNFLSFLEMVGVEQKAGNPAEVPVTFLPAKSAQTGGHIPAGTRVATTQTDTADAQVFETRGAFYATPAKLKEVINLIPQQEKYRRLTLIDLPPKEPGDIDNDAGRIIAFKEEDETLQWIDHILYLDNQYLFGGKEPVKLVLQISLENGRKEIFHRKYLLWKRYVEDDDEWQEIDNAGVSYVPKGAGEPVEVTIDDFSGTGQSEVNGVEGYWLACHFTGPFEEGLELPVVTDISGSIATPGAPGLPTFTRITEKDIKVEEIAIEINYPSPSGIHGILYLDNQDLFERKEAVKLVLEFSVEFAMEDVWDDLKEAFDPGYMSFETYNEYDKAWQKIDNASVSYEISEYGKVKITIDPFYGTDKSKVQEVEGYWTAWHFNLPPEFEQWEWEGIDGELKGISLSTPPSDVVTSFTTKIETAFANTAPIDLSKPVYPFGQRPQYGDAFYMGSLKTFPPDIQFATLKFKIHPYTNADLQEIYKNIKEGTGGEVTVKTDIDWEYLDKNEEWQNLATFSHSFTASKTGDGVIIHRPSNNTDKNGTFFGNGTSSQIKITLYGFDHIALKEWNNEESYWIRAVIKTFDPYGKDAWIETAGDTYTVIGPTFIPPIIEDISITYTYKIARVPVNAIQTENNFQYTVQAGGSQPPIDPFIPFIPITAFPVGNNPCFIDKKPALYLGFDKAFGDVYISLFFHIAETLSAAGYALEQGNPIITWEYAAEGYSWKPLDVNDHTADLTTSGTVAFTGPSDAIKLSLFQDDQSGGYSLYWYRARLTQGHYDYPPVIRGIYLNTVMADQQTVAREDQVIGSGNGTANQKLTLIRVPILKGDVWVIEAEKPGEEELEILKNEFLKLPGKKEEIETTGLVREIITSEGKEEIRVQWLNVPNFLASGLRSRHYTLDAVKGEITFGNGEKGLIPPPGKDNILIQGYCTGGGEEANTAASPLAVKELKSSLPYIDKVFNIQNAVAGSNPWTLEQTMVFGPQSIKNRDRAVTVEDYEWMVLQQFSQVARARCIPTRVPAADGKLVPKSGAATVIIVPKTSHRKPLPPKGLLKNIRDFLRQKALGTIFEHIHVIGPNFQEINISAAVVPQKPEESSIVERRIIKALEAFFHPLTGGENREGWNFGRDVYISEVYAVIERTQGAAYVKKAWFTGSPEAESLEVGNNCLVYSGTHDIEMEMN